MKTRNWGVASQRILEWEAGKGNPFVLSVQSVWERFIADNRAVGVGDAQIRYYELMQREMVERFPDSSFASVSLDDLSKYRESWKVGKSTKRSRLGRLRALYAFAMSRGFVPVNLAKLLSSPKMEKKQVHPFSDSEVEKIFWAVDLYKDYPKGGRDKLRALLLLLRYSGLRIGDAVCFKKADLVDDRIVLHTEKAKTMVSLRVPPVVVEALKKCDDGSEHYFWSGASKKKTCITHWQATLSKLFTLAGVKGHPHMFRHYFSTQLLSKGVSVENVAKILGHKTSRITEEYYSAWIQSRQDLLDMEVAKVWSS